MNSNNLPQARKIRQGECQEQLNELKKKYHDDLLNLENEFLSNADDGWKFSNKKLKKKNLVEKKTDITTCQNSFSVISSTANNCMITKSKTNPKMNANINPDLVKRKKHLCNDYDIKCEQIREIFCDPKMIWAYGVLMASNKIKIVRSGMYFDNNDLYTNTFGLKIVSVKNNKLCVQISKNDLLVINNIKFDIKGRCNDFIIDGNFLIFKDVCEELTTCCDNDNQHFVPDCFVKHIDEFGDNFQKFSMKNQCSYWDLAFMCLKFSYECEIDEVLCKKCRYGSSCTNYYQNHLVNFCH